MKKFKFWSMILLTAMMLPAMVACGDDEENETTQIVDGVNVNNGKRLVELSIGSENDTVPEVIKINYDQKGRMIEFLYKELLYDNGIRKIGNTGNFLKLVEIDYDLLIIKYHRNSNWSRSYGFTINNDGHITQLGTCFFTYDTNGYLQGVEDAQRMSTFAYSEGDIIKASATKIKSGNVNMFFVTYGNKQDSGDLYVRIERDGKIVYGGISNDIGFLIAYQAGLFGKVSKRILNLKSESEKTAFLDHGGTYSWKFKFKFQ